LMFPSRVKLLERIARILLGEPAAVVPVGRMTRLEEVEYREKLRAAERRGDADFLRREIDQNQLTEADLRRLEGGATPLSEWPEPDEDLFAPNTFEDGKEPTRR
jgi:hypothetical protein